MGLPIAIESGLQSPDLFQLGLCFTLRRIADLDGHISHMLPDQYQLTTILHSSSMLPLLP